MTLQARIDDPAILVQDLDRWIEVITPTDRDVALWRVLDRWLRATQDTPRHKVLRFLVQPHTGEPSEAAGQHRPQRSLADVDLTDSSNEFAPLPQCA